MRLEEICRQLAQTGHYSAQVDDDILRIQSSDIGSEYIMEAFEQSAQIRQAVWFDCDKLSVDDLNRIYVLCSMMNERFGGCKCFIDQWGVLITGADLISNDIVVELIETTLRQVEFISQAMLDLVETLCAEGRLVTQHEIDTVLAVPSLQ